MKVIRKLLGLKPKIGDSVAGHLDYGITYEGIVLETRYCKDTLMPGAYVSGKIIISSMWKGQIIEEDPRFFVPLNRLRIV